MEQPLLNQRDFERIKALVRRATRKLQYNLRMAMWSLKHKPITDEERFALNLAQRHIQEGRLDLAEEDLRWLGNR